MDRNAVEQSRTAGMGFVELAGGRAVSQNRSTAVMQRRVEAHDSLDDFPTPPWATRALCEWLSKNHSQPLDLFKVREPAANRGYMARPLAEYFKQVEASDVHDYGYGFPVNDYLWGPIPEAVDWTITNPPFRLAEQFIQRALQSSRQGVAVIVRSAFLEGKARFESLFDKVPPHFILRFVERAPMCKGKVDPNVSSATSYSWIIWLADSGRADTRLRWIPPCRKKLERESDYAGAAA